MAYQADSFQPDAFQTDQTVTLELLDQSGTPFAPVVAQSVPVVQQHGVVPARLNPSRPMALNQQITSSLIDAAPHLYAPAGFLLDFEEVDLEDLLALLP